MMSMFEVYNSKEPRAYPRLEFRDRCLDILRDKERSSDKWIAVGQKAPTEEVMNNILSRRTKLTNPLWIEALMEGLGYNSVEELMGDEGN